MTLPCPQCGLHNCACIKRSATSYQGQQIDAEAIKQAVPPPLGLKPRHFWEEERIKEIVLAMARYVEAGKKIPHAWVSELYDYVPVESK